MLNMSSVIVSGKIIHAASEGEGMLLLITQIAYNLFETQVHIYLADDAFTWYRESGIKIGDEVLISGAVMYNKSGQLRFRITSKEQLQKLTPSKEDLMLGRESAKEKFM